MWRFSPRSPFKNKSLLPRWGECARGCRELSHVTFPGAAGMPSEAGWKDLHTLAPYGIMWWAILTPRLPANGRGLNLCYNPGTAFQVRKLYAAEDRVLFRNSPAGVCLRLIYSWNPGTWICWACGLPGRVTGFAAELSSALVHTWTWILEIAYVRLQNLVLAYYQFNWKAAEKVTMPFFFFFWWQVIQVATTCLDGGGAFWLAPDHWMYKTSLLGQIGETLNPHRIFSQ